MKRFSKKKRVGRIYFVRIRGVPRPTKFNIFCETMKHKQFAHKNVKSSLMHIPESELIVIKNNYFVH